MQDDDAKSLSALGFLTVIEHPPHGLFGGYLVLNRAGRPLEFHCTAPVKPNRAQEILYGPTLMPYLYGEQIGQTLVGKSKVAPQIVLTNVAPVLALRELVTTPVALILPETEAADGHSYRVDAAHSGPRLAHFQAGRHRMAVADNFAADGELLTGPLARLAEQLDLAEPFERIRDAIAEAQKISP